MHCMQPGFDHQLLQLNPQPGIVWNKPLAPEAFAAFT